MRLGCVKWNILHYHPQIGSRCSCCVGVLFIYYILSFYSVEKSVYRIGLCVILFFFFLLPPRESFDMGWWFGRVALVFVFRWLIFLNLSNFDIFYASLKCTQTTTKKSSSSICSFNAGFVDDDVFPGELQLFAQFEFQWILLKCLVNAQNTIYRFDLW